MLSIAKPQKSKAYQKNLQTESRRKVITLQIPEMKKVYTIINTTLTVKDNSVDIPFAIGFIDDGIYYFETILKENDFYQNNRNSYFTLNGVSDNGDDIEAVGLICRSHNFQSGSCTFECDRYVKIQKNDYLSNLDHGKADDTRKDGLFAIEIEGFKMQFANRTPVPTYKKGDSIDNFFNYKYDHTQCGLTINDVTIGENLFNLIFTLNVESSNVIIDFTQTYGYGTLYYEDYRKFRLDLLHFLSFINGGNINLKSELTGSYHSTSYKNGGLDAHIVYRYSLKSQENQFCSDYLPINQNHSVSGQNVNYMEIDANRYYQTGNYSFRYQYYQPVNQVAALCTRPPIIKSKHPFTRPFIPSLCFSSNSTSTNFKITI